MTAAVPAIQPPSTGETTLEYNVFGSVYLVWGVSRVVEVPLLRVETSICTLVLRRPLYDKFRIVLRSPLDRCGATQRASVPNHSWQPRSHPCPPERSTSPHSATATRWVFLIRVSWWCASLRAGFSAFVHSRSLMGALLLLISRE